MSEPTFDMFDVDMGEEDDEQDATQLPDEVDNDYDASTADDDDDEEEVEEVEMDPAYVGMTVKERARAILEGEYFDHSVIQHYEKFYDNSVLTKRGQANLENKRSSPFVALITGEKLIKIAGATRATPDAKAAATRVVDQCTEALVGRAAILAVLNKQRTIRDAHVHGANKLVGKYPV